MKHLVTELKDGMEVLLGKKITCFCINYIYTGTLVGVNNTCIKLEDPAIVYETGAFTNDSYKDVQPLTVKHWYIQLAAIESFGALK